MPQRRTLTLPWALGIGVLACACTETPYDLIGDPEALSGSGGSDGGASVTGGAASESGGRAATGGEQGLSSPGCDAARDPSLTVERILSVSEELCVGQGGPIVLADDPGYEVTLQPCDAVRWQHWTLEQVDTSVTSGTDYLEIRNENVDLNLDVRFAAPDDGTPAVLYDPHLLYNQLFSLLPLTSDTFQLSPRHAQGKCLEARLNRLEIWPCDASVPEQAFERIACEDSEAL